MKRKSSPLININHLKQQWLKIDLKEKIYALDTLQLRRHKLTGLLKYDIENTPKDTIPKISFEMPTIKDNRAPLNMDKQDLKKPPSADHPNLGNYGIYRAIPIRDYRYEALLRFKQELKRKADFPLLITKDFGIDFFTKELQINYDAINHFLEYCEFSNLMKTYYEGDRFKVINILIEESKNYRKTFNQQ